MLKVKETLRSILNEREDINIAKIARLSGVPKANIAGWLNGSSPNLIQLDKVATLLGVSLEYLAFGRREHAKFAPPKRIILNDGSYEISIKKIPATDKEKSNDKE